MTEAGRNAVSLQCRTCTSLILRPGVGEWEEDLSQQLPATRQKKDLQSGELEYESLTRFHYIPLLPFDKGG